MNEFSNIKKNTSKDLNKNVETIGESKLVNDPRLNDMWHLKNLGIGYNVKDVDLNIIDVWKTYTGKGIDVGIIDDGFDYNHPDLEQNYDKKRDYDALDKDSNAISGSHTNANKTTHDKHGTMVMGVIAATRNNNEGGAGVAPDATVIGHRMGFGIYGTFEQEYKLLEMQKNYDITNNSWGYGGYFYDDYKSSNFKKQDSAINDAVSKGRDGLGSIIVFAAGNDRAKGQNVNYHCFNSDRRTISVAAIASYGDVAMFSTPGAAILVAAPGQSVLTTYSEPDGFGGTRRTYKPVNGTSFASPAIAGVCALILEANPNLGWRDMQEILAYTSRKNILTDYDWSINSSRNWNGGGMHFSHDFGFGMPDAAAAVRLAESWDKKSTSYNEHSIEAYSGNINKQIADNGSISNSLTMNKKMDIDDVEIDIKLHHRNLGDLVIKLVSPTGTEAILMDRPGVGSKSTTGVGNFNLNFTFTARNFRGETGNGEWKIIVEDTVSGKTGTLQNWKLRLIGDKHTVNNSYIYTDEYAGIIMANSTQSTLIDTNGGKDKLNFAAMSKGISINMTPGSSNLLMEQAFSISNNTIIEDIIGTHARDVITGNKYNNKIFSGDGDDLVNAGDGNDYIVGGKGRDTLTGGKGRDIFVYRSAKDAGDVITDFKSGKNGDIIDLSQWVIKQNYQGRNILRDGLVRLVRRGSNAMLLVKQKSSNSRVYKRMATLQNVSSGNFDKSNFRFH